MVGNIILMPSICCILLTRSSIVPANPELAGQMLSLVERLTGSHQPFVWLLFRPPWSSDSCSKASIFRSMQEMAKEGTVRYRPPAAHEAVLCCLDCSSCRPSHPSSATSRFSPLADSLLEGPCSALPRLWLSGSRNALKMLLNGICGPPRRAVELPRTR